MTEEYRQTTIVANKFEINPILEYLQTNYGLASAGTFNIKEGGKIKIQSNEGKVEVMCKCDEKVTSKLIGLIEQNE